MSECLHLSVQTFGTAERGLQKCDDCHEVVDQWFPGAARTLPLVISGVTSQAHTYRHKHGEVIVTVWDSDAADGAFVVQIDTTFDRQDQQLRVNVGEGTVWGREHGSPENEAIAQIRNETIESYVGAGCMVLDTNGNPIDMTPALRAQGVEAWKNADDILTARHPGLYADHLDADRLNQTRRALAIGTLRVLDITGPLADACLVLGEKWHPMYQTTPAPEAGVLVIPEEIMEPGSPGADATAYLAAQWMTQGGGDAPTPRVVIARRGESVWEAMERDRQERGKNSGS